MLKKIKQSKFIYTLFIFIKINWSDKYIDSLKYWYYNFFSLFCIYIYII